MNASTTRNHSKPRTPWPESQNTAYASVVHGSRKKPRSGTIQLSKARLSRSLKIQMAKSARLGEISARSAARQAITATIQRGLRQRRGHSAPPGKAFRPSRVEAVRAPRGQFGAGPVDIR